MNAVLREDDAAPRTRAARALGEFLRSPEAQQGLLAFGRGDDDDRPPFCPVQLGRPRRFAIQESPVDRDA